SLSGEARRACASCSCRARRTASVLGLALVSRRTSSASASISRSRIKSAMGYLHWISGSSREGTMPAPMLRGGPARLAFAQAFGLVLQCACPRMTHYIASEEVSMGSTVEVAIPVESEAAKALEAPARREAVGRYLSGLLKAGRLPSVLAEAIADAKREARASELTDDDIDA